jgi:hypothetical protein
VTPYEAKSQIKLFLEVGNRREASRLIRATAIEVTPELIPRLTECLESKDLQGRLLIALAIGDRDPGLIATTLQETLEDPQYKSISTNIPLTVWVDSLISIWVGKLQVAGIELPSGRLAQVLTQVLPAMLEI